ncbi:hypothetical protein JCM10450v2_006807 [Rhodotorula kratochvilovae]
MADPSAPHSSNQLFDSYVYYAAEAAKLARTACSEREDLATRVKTLEDQLALSKLGHQEEQKKARNAQKQLDVVANDQIIYCVLDGDGCIFHRSLVAKGRDGGREAAILLIKHIDDYASTLGITGQLTIVVHLYLNKAGLSRVIQSCGIADEATFSAFLTGFNAAHPLILVSDVGPSKEASDAKLSQTLKLYAKLPSTKLVLAGAAHDGGYAHLFSSLETEAPLVFDKCTLLKSYIELAFELKRLNLRATTFEGLFENKKLVSYAGQAVPPPPGALATPRKSSPAVVQATPTPGKTKTPRTVTKATLAAVKENLVAEDSPARAEKLRPIDPTKPLYKQALGPPCNKHYLLPPSSPSHCASPSTCKYSHAYALSPTQLATLRTDAGKSPCFAVLKGRECTDEACFAGHVCPRGVGCNYGNKCKFTAPGMHPPGTKGRTDGWAWRSPSTPSSPAPAAGRAASAPPARQQYVSAHARAARFAYDSSSAGSGTDGYETTSSVD